MIMADSTGAILRPSIIAESSAFKTVVTKKKKQQQLIIYDYFLHHKKLLLPILCFVYCYDFISFRP
jgi:hypothetical protein